VGFERGRSPGGYAIVGVKTNVVTAVEIRDKDAPDAPLLPPMLRTTAENFTMREVSADKVYASLDNYAEISQAGAVPYIPFKSNESVRWSTSGRARENRRSFP
jgi:hypothetical protein